MKSPQKSFRQAHQVLWFWRDRRAAKAEFSHVSICFFIDIFFILSIELNCCRSNQARVTSKMLLIALPWDFLLQLTFFISLFHPNCVIIRPPGNNQLFESQHGEKSDASRWGWERLCGDDDKIFFDNSIWWFLSNFSNTPIDIVQSRVSFISWCLYVKRDRWDKKTVFFLKSLFSTNFIVFICASPKVNRSTELFLYRFDCKSSPTNLNIRLYFFDSIFPTLA